MDTVTYPNEKVQKLLADRLVCCKPLLEEEKILADRYNARWTPGLFWLKGEDDVCHRNIGYFEPDEFLAESHLGLGLTAGYSGDWSQALSDFEAIIEHWPDSFATPAARYWAGVAAMHAHEDSDALIKHWKALREKHQSSAWSMKVSFIDD